MKKIFLMFLIVASAQVLLGQGSLVVSAYNDYRNHYVKSSKENIDKAILDESYTKEAKTWLYRGNIYLQVYSVAHMTDGLKKGMTMDEVKQRYGDPLKVRRNKKLEDGERWSFNFDLVINFSKGIVHDFEYPDEALYRSLDDGKTLEVAYEAYQKSLALDPKYMNPQISPPTAMAGLEALAGTFYNAGITAYGANNFKESQYHLEKAVMVYTDLKKPNPELVYYTGVAALQAGDTTKALMYYNRAAKMDYKDKLLYYNMVNIYMTQGQMDAAKKVIAKGREIHPKDQDLLITEANIYLKTGEADKAEAILLEAVKNDPTNANLYYVIGANYDNIINDTISDKEAKEHAFDEAQKAYKKALELKPDYFDATFNMGVLLNNKAAEIFNYINNLDINETEKYNAGKEKALGYLKQAKPYLEKALELNSKDRDTLILLKQIYLKENNTEKYKEVDALLKSL